MQYLNLLAENEPYLAGFQQDIAAAVLANQLILGPGTKHFEAAYAEYLCQSHGSGQGSTAGLEVIGCANGLEALQLILLGLQIGPGDEVLVPAHTCDATWLSVLHTGAKPVPVDADPATLNLAPALAAAAITPRTRALVAVHMHGLPCDMDALASLCQAHSIYLLEDNAQATGATWRGQLTGNGRLSLAAAHSFYPTKNLGALGDAGAVSTADPALAARVRALRNYGKTDAVSKLRDPGGVEGEPVSNSKVLHPAPRIPHLVGLNSRLDEIQALFLLRKLAGLAKALARRRHLASLYQEGLAGHPHLTLQAVPEQAEPGWHHLIVRTQTGPGRDRLAAHLAGSGIGSAIHYVQTPAQALGLPGPATPVADAIATTTLSLPIYPSLSEADVKRAVAVCQTFVES